MFFAQGVLRCRLEVASWKFNATEIKRNFRFTLACCLDCLNFLLGTNGCQIRHRQQDIRNSFLFTTARKRSLAKAMFSQARVCPEGEGMVSRSLERSHGHGTWIPYPPPPDIRYWTWMSLPCY